MRRDALLVATLSPYPHHSAMPTTTTTRPGEWTPERTASDNVIQMANGNSWSYVDSLHARKSAPTP
jgi:hypothetical protein